MKKKKTISKKEQQRRKVKKIRQMQKWRKNSPSSGSIIWTTNDEIRWLRSKRDKMSQFLIQYIKTCKSRSKWGAMKKEVILSEARKLLRKDK